MGRDKERVQVRAPFPVTSTTISRKWEEPIGYHKAAVGSFSYRVVVGATVVLDYPSSAMCLRFSKR